VNLNPIALATASALAIAVIWTLCSLLVFALPAAMSGMTGHMVHAHLESFTWVLTWTGYLIGLVAWTVWAAITGWLIAVVYNRVAAD
jgi:hypothetical protein